MNTGGGVFGDPMGAPGIGSVIPSDIHEEGFEDLGGPGLDDPGAPYQPMPFQPIPAPSGGGRPARRPATRGPAAPRPVPGYPTMGLGQDAVPLVQVQQCSRVGPALAGALAGGLICGVSVWAYFFFRDRSD